MSAPVPRGTNGYAVAAAGARPNAGIGGIYRKRAFKLLVANNASVVGPISGATIPAIKLPFFPLSVTIGPIAVSNLLITYASAGGGVAVGFAMNAEVKCPSTRVKVAFGMGSLNGDTGEWNAVPATFNMQALASAWVNVVPAIAVPGMGASGPQPDNTGYIYGQPIFRCDSADASAIGVGQYDPRFIWSPPDFITAPTTSIANPGNLPTTNYPFAYEDCSDSDCFRIQGGIFANRTANPIFIQGPIYAWAVWEIVDPRDGEDTTAILNECTLEAPTLQIGPGL